MTDRQQPEWYATPVNGLDLVDAAYVTDALCALDAISSRHRTDAFRILAARYRDDLLKMQRENAEKQAT